ncbi:response regulator [Brasilonema sp. UFV-L1]|uniref:response regulator n=1 Tax=Brasilonema sp. UFV-L1 TaxID=2234130 RepID=UPI00145E6393|nr:response regulator [Brasilonema sp. UFV-L1]NMG07345.1 two-component system response regulator [Brasilonema sp. UFV-L1]
MSTKHILVIDDEKNLCIIIKTCLEYFGGWQVRTSTESKHGLLLASTEVPDAILLDVIMPKMDGLMVLTALQSHSMTQNIPVILLTAKVEKQDLIQYTRLSIAGIIVKPFDPLKLAVQVAELLKWEKIENVRIHAHQSQ